MHLREGLAIGCAIDEGTIYQVYVLGRHDYLGRPVNTSSKLQALAWNEVCLSPRFYENLTAEGIKLPEPVPMASRAIRISSTEVVKRWPKGGTRHRFRR